MRYRRLLVVLGVCSTLACGAPAGELPEWFVPVPEGTPLREYPEFPSPSAAGGTVELVPDLVLGDGTGDPAYQFYGPSWVDVAADGRIFVADFGNQRIQVFGPDGEYRQTLGRRGQGPGEFDFSGYVILEIAGDRVFIDDHGNRRFSVWRTGGEHLRDVSYARGRLLNGFEAIDEETLVATLLTLRARREGDFWWRRQAVSLIKLDGSPVQDLAALDVPPALRSESLGVSISSVVRRRLDYAVDRTTRTIYITPEQPYQVFAFAGDGAMHWALRARHEAVPYPDDEKEAPVQRLRETRGLLAEIDDFDWPDTLPDIYTLEVDGHGHLYVFRYDLGALRREFTVDVYDRDGDHLFSGAITGAQWRWEAALDDHVYGWRDLEDGNRTVARYRILEPFD